MSDLDRELGKAFVGPPEPPERWHRPRELEGRMEEPKRNLLKELAPLLIAQGLDLLSTELTLRDPAVHAEEANPLPGANHTAGRVGWMLAKALMNRELLKQSKSVGKPIVIANMLGHLYATENNNTMRREANEGPR